MDRRDFLTAIGTVVIASRAARLRGQTSITAPADAWPHFRGTATLTGVSSATVPNTLKRLWVWEAGTDAPVDSSPAIVGGVVYVGTGAGELVALGLDDGKLRWRYKAGESIGESSPAVAAGRVFIGDLEGGVHAVNASDGKRVWNHKTRSEVKSSPTISGDLLLIGSYDGILYALGAADGKPRWQLKTENYVHGTPAISDGVAYFAGCDEIFHAARLKDGQKVFEASATAYTGASVALQDGVGYFGTFDNQVVAFDVKSRKVLWRYEHHERKFHFYSSDAVSDGVVRCVVRLVISSGYIEPNPVDRRALPPSGRPTGNDEIV